MATLEHVRAELRQLIDQPPQALRADADMPPADRLAALRQAAKALRAIPLILSHRPNWVPPPDLRKLAERLTTVEDRLRELISGPHPEGTAATTLLAQLQADFPTTPRLHEGAQ